MARLAVSSHRGWIVEKPLIVLEVPLPPKVKISLRLADFGYLRSDDSTLQAFEKSLEKAVSSPSKDGSIVVTSEVHSECQLVAHLLGRAKIAGNLVPCIRCSKLNCYVCHLWLKAFNLQHDVKVAFGGTDGGMMPGWMPPV